MLVSCRLILMAPFIIRSSEASRNIFSDTHITNEILNIEEKVSPSHHNFGTTGCLWIVEDFLVAHEERIRQAFTYFLGQIFWSLLLSNLVGRAAIWSEKDCALCFGCTDNKNKKPTSNQMNNIEKYYFVALHAYHVAVPCSTYNKWYDAIYHTW